MADVSIIIPNYIGRYVKFLDSDDIIEKETLCKGVYSADKEYADIVVSAFSRLIINSIVAGSKSVYPPIYIKNVNGLKIV